MMLRLKREVHQLRNQGESKFPKKEMIVQARKASPHLGTDLQLLRLFLEIEDIDHPLIVKDAPKEVNIPTIESGDTQEAVVIRVRGDLEDIIIIDSQIIIEEGDHHLVLQVEDLLVAITTEIGTTTVEEGTEARLATILIGIDTETIEESRGDTIVMKETDIKGVGPDLDELESLCLYSTLIDLSIKNIWF